MFCDVGRPSSTLGAGHESPARGSTRGALCRAASGELGSFRRAGLAHPCFGESIPSCSASQHTLSLKAHGLTLPPLRPRFFHLPTHSLAPHTHSLPAPHAPSPLLARTPTRLTRRLPALSLYSTLANTTPFAKGLCSEPLLNMAEMAQRILMNEFKQLSKEKWTNIEVSS